MPSELRCIVFESADVVQATREYYSCRKLAFPSGAILKTLAESWVGWSGIRFIITIVAHPDVSTTPFLGCKAQQEIVIDESTLTAALILYCREKHIPLPAGAEKHLRLIDGKVSLLLTNNPEGNDITIITQSTLSI